MVVEGPWRSGSTKPFESQTGSWDEREVGGRGGGGGRSAGWAGASGRGAVGRGTARAVSRVAWPEDEGGGRWAAFLKLARPRGQTSWRRAGGR